MKNINVELMFGAEVSVVISLMFLIKISMVMKMNFLFTTFEGSMGVEAWLPSPSML
jgi:hypothetical protein